MTRDDEEVDGHNAYGDDPEAVTLSAYFEAAECCFARQRSVKLPLSSKLLDHLCGLYASSSRSDIIGMLQSARCCEFDDGQLTVIGTAADELVDVLDDVVVDCPTDILYAITDFVGDALVWMRSAGMNAVKWSVVPNAVERSHLDVHCAVNGGEADRVENGENESEIGSDSVGVTSSMAMDAVGGQQALDSDFTFYFSGYGLDELELDSAMVHSLDGQCPLIFVDLDWIFAAFLVLGVVPEDADGRAVAPLFESKIGVGAARKQLTVKAHGDGQWRRSVNARDRWKGIDISNVFHFVVDYYLRF